MSGVNTYFMNIAPTASSESGFVRLVAEMDGEKVLSLDANIGFSHRGIEKSLENSSVLQGLCYFDSIRMLTSLSQEHAFVLAVEKICAVDVPERARLLRLILAELTRIVSHLNATACLAADLGESVVGAIVARTNRRLFSLFEKACGACVPKAFFRVGGLKNDVPQDFIPAVRQFLTQDLNAVLKEIRTLTTDNRIFKKRTQNIGVIELQDAENYGFSGVNLRACGNRFDVRKSFSYDGYDRFEFDVPTAEAGDCFSRCLLRLEEISQSVRIILQAADVLPEGDICASAYALSEEKKPLEGVSLAGTAARFDFYTQGMELKQGEAFVLTEAPYGAFGVYLISRGGSKPYRCHIRSAGFAHLQALKLMTKGCFLEDIRPIVSSLDIQMPEVDR